MSGDQQADEADKARRGWSLAAYPRWLGSRPRPEGGHDEWVSHARTRRFSYGRVVCGGEPQGCPEIRQATTEAKSEFQKQLVLIGAGNRLPAEFGTSKDAESIRFLHDKRLTLFNTRREHEWKIYFGAMALLCAADAVLLSGSLPPP